MIYSIYDMPPNARPISHVTANGTEVKFCFRFDPDEGWAECYVGNNDGTIQVDENGIPRTTRIAGKVLAE